jgi:hypothetical protein
MVWENLSLMSKRKYLNKSDKIKKKNQMVLAGIAAQGTIGENAQIPSIF